MHAFWVWTWLFLSILRNQSFTWWFPVALYCKLLLNQPHHASPCLIFFLFLIYHLFNTDQRPEAELKGSIASRKVQKADREKLRRDRLNEQFTELGSTLGKFTCPFMFIIWYYLNWCLAQKYEIWNIIWILLCIFRDQLDRNECKEMRNVGLS